MKCVIYTECGQDCIKNIAVVYIDNIICGNCADKIIEYKKPFGQKVVEYEMP